MNTDLPIEVRGTTKRYGDFTLDGVDLAVEAGQIVGFIGQNGAGKSTTIKALLGLVGLDSGEARILGVPSAELARTSASKVKERVGVVFDTIAMPSHLTVAEVAQLMSCAYSTWDEQAFSAMISRFKLDRAKTVKDLSRGMGMKLSLACALAHNPQVLILDEATAGLDPMARDEVLDLLREFVAVEGPNGEPVNAILMSSHITSDLEKIADEIVCIDAGKIMFTCAKDEITDMMGVARCRMADMESLLQGGALGQEGEVRMLRHDYGIDLLVHDRFEFMREHPEIPCDRMSIDEYMTFMLKGEAAMGFGLPKGGER
ncbi:MAG: ABC transporter ATP-binding protein [Coriobacteriaceae bacterium]|nr:ABC transporter ATP-binding protein [Coriobacteriaceae bacterium]